MLLIETVEIDSSYLPTLYCWFEDEWGDVDALTKTKHGKVIPKPIIVLKNGKLIGGLVFTRFLSPITQEQAVWINAVFIKAENRQQGIGAQLIRHAEKAVAAMNEFELLVFTHLPTLYTNLQWQIIETEGDHFVLKSALVV